MKEDVIIIDPNRPHNYILSVPLKVNFISAPVHKRHRKGISRLALTPHGNCLREMRIFRDHRRSNVIRSHASRQLPEWAGIFRDHRRSNVVCSHASRQLPEKIRIFRRQAKRCVLLSRLMV
jgi:hypothetical protein